MISSLSHMRVSVIIRAHNEEKYIRTCIESVLKQTKTPDEILVIAHNCSDQTVAIASSFPEVTVLPLTGPRGSVYALDAGVAVVKHEVIACIDADSYAADDHWLKSLVTPLEDLSVSGVGGYVFLVGYWIATHLLSWDFFFLSPHWKKDYSFYVWGANSAFRKKDFERLGGVSELFELKSKLPLHFWAEDLFLSLKLGQIGKVVFAKNAKVISHSPRLRLRQWRERIRENTRDTKKLFAYFKKASRPRK